MESNNDEMLNSIDTLKHKLAALNDDDSPEINRLIDSLDGLRSDIIKEDKRRDSHTKPAALLLCGVCIVVFLVIIGLVVLS